MGEQKCLKYDAGVAGLNLLLSIVVMLFIIGFLVMIFALMGGEIEPEVYDASSDAIINSTTDGVVNDTGVYPLGITADQRRTCVLTVTRYNNESDLGLGIGTGNFTVDNCLIKCITSGDCEAGFNNTLINVTGTYTYEANTTASETIAQATGSLSEVTDWFGIIIVLGAMVVLLLLTVIIITAIRGSGFMGTSSASKTSA